YDQRRCSLLSLPIPLGDPMQLKCSLVSKNSSTLQCPSKRNLLWFRSGAGESPGSIIYTYEEQTEEQNQRRCVYSLSTTIQDVSDTGTYYCAVATCGHVLFGPGTRVEIRPDNFKHLKNTWIYS
uniref:Ig-like domain-containing protein n=1 Tax=Periophthalmus magnuspinnatus TaxID=409849 RepID=A0A3B4AE90_9GOBI